MQFENETKYTHVLVYTAECVIVCNDADELNS